MVEVYMWVNDLLMMLLLVCDILVGVNVKLCSLVCNGYLFGVEVWFDFVVNEKDSFKSGKLVIDYDYMFVLLLEDFIFC